MSGRKLSAYLTLGWFPHALGHVDAPNLLVAARHVGASVGIGLWSIAGIPFVAAGLFMLVWAMVTHYRDSPDEIQHLLPTYLSTCGAYGVSRNPLYLGGALLWVGWAIAWLSSQSSAPAPRSSDSSRRSGSRTRNASSGLDTAPGTTSTATACRGGSRLDLDQADAARRRLLTAKSRAERRTS